MINIKCKKYFLLLLTLMSWGLQSSASHLVAGYISYDYKGTLSNGKIRYAIRLNMFRDCSSQVILEKTAIVGIYSNNANRDLYRRIEVPLVKQEIVKIPGNISCPFERDNSCVEQGFYEVLFDIDPSTVGYILYYDICCRNNQVNLTDGPGGIPNQGQIYTAVIPPTDYQNSSAQFFGIPSPYMCANDTTDFLFNALDKDGDVLTYKFVQPYDGRRFGEDILPTNIPSLENLKKVEYSPNHSVIQPFGPSGYISIAENSGLTRLFTTKGGNYTIAVEVTETRNGIVLNRMRMDIQILVLLCPQNQKPKFTLPLLDKYVVAAGDKICFPVSAIDPDGEDLTLTADGEPYGKNGYKGTRPAIVQKIGKGTVTDEFCWQTDCNSERDAIFLVQFIARDNGCPSKFSAKLVEIEVKAFSAADGILGQSPVCNYSVHTYTAQKTNVNTTFEWEVIGGEIVGPSNGKSVSIKWNSTEPGTVRMREVLPFGCFGEWVTKVVNINFAPPLPMISGKDTVCKDEANVAYQIIGNPSSTYQWLVFRGNLTNNASLNTKVNWAGPGNGWVAAIEKDARGCASDTSFFPVFISQPQTRIEGPTSVCPNSKSIVYSALPLENGSTYDWQVTGGINQTNSTSSNLLAIDWGGEGAGTISVTETNRFGCIASTSLSVNKTYNLDPLTIIGDPIVCEGDQQIPYEVISSQGSKYGWNIEGGTQVLGDSNAAILVNWGSQGIGRVKVTQYAFDQTENRECRSPEAVLLVLINPLPIADEILGADTFCQYAPEANFSINGYASSTFNWVIEGGEKIESGQGTNTISVIWDVAGKYKIKVLEVTSGGCFKDTVVLEVVVNPRPVTSPIEGALVICPESISPQTYRVNGFSNSVFQWYAEGEIQLSGNGTPAVSVEWDLNDPWGYLKVVEISEFNCSGDTIEQQIDKDLLEFELAVVSVGLPDNKIKGDWILLNPASSSAFDVLKRAGLSLWNPILTVPGSETTFTEFPINTDEEAFTYKISATNRCGTLLESNPHTTILLTGNVDDNESAVISFTDYFGWKNGVDFYEIYHKVNNGGYDLSRSNVLPGDTFVFDRVDANFQQCYRIRAIENGGNLTESWSNEICFVYTPRVYIPNAFTPNNDALNNTFNIIKSSVVSYQLEIFNRWGELLFATVDLDQGWDGTYLNKPAQDGVYVYRLYYEDYFGKAYNQSGTIHLLR